MSILLVSATNLEIGPARHTLKKRGIPIAITGVGCAPALYHILKAVQKSRPSLLIQAGIGGCFDHQYALGEVVAISEDFFGDLGVEEAKTWRSASDIGLIPPQQKPFKNGRLPNPHRSILKKCGLPVVPAVTVNEISTNQRRIQLLKDQGIVIESMEGAALHYVGLMEKIPFLQLRSLSNYVGERNKQKWRLEEAIENLNAALLRVTEQWQAAVEAGK